MVLEGNLNKQVEWGCLSLGITSCAFISEAILNELNRLISITDRTPTYLPSAPKDDYTPENWANLLTKMDQYAGETRH